MKKSEIVALAIQAGFSGYFGCGLSGESEDDELLYVDEYPVGESVLKFARLLGVEIESDL